MKKLLCLLTVSVSLFLTPAPAVSAAQEGIAAIVNDSVITVTDIKDRANLYMSASSQAVRPEERQKLDQQVLNLLIDEVLQMQEARKLGISVGDEDVTVGFADISRQNGTTPEEFRKRLTQAGVTLDSLHSKIRADIAWSQVVRRKLRPQVNISEGEIELTLNQMSRSSGKSRYHVAEIFLNVPDPVKDDDTRREAAKLVKHLTEGASFTSVAQAFSQAPGASGGGDLGWVQEGQLDAALDKALEKMQPGQVSPPVRSSRGYHILFLRDVSRNTVTEDAGGQGSGAGDNASREKDNASREKDDASHEKDNASREKIAAQLGLQLLDRMSSRYLHDLRTAAFIDKRI